MKVHTTALCMALLASIFVGAAHGKDKEADEQVYAIQERIFDRHHEVGLVVGYIPDEDFHNIFPVGLSYTYNFNENLAWEVVRAQWAFTAEKDLKNDLEDDFGAAPSKFDEMKYLIHSHLLLKPSYGKDAVLNKGIVNHETYVFLGGGVVAYDRDFTNGDNSTETAFSLSFGAARKYFLTENLCLNLEIRDLINFKEDDTVNDIYLGFALGFRFNLSPRKKLTDPTAEKLQKILSKDGSHE